MNNQWKITKLDVKHPKYGEHRYTNTVESIPAGCGYYTINLDKQTAEEISQAFEKLTLRIEAIINRELPK